MLEKSRVVNYSFDEGNFHIFYSLFAGATRQQLDELSLKEAKDYKLVFISDRNKDSVCICFLFVFFKEFACLLWIHLNSLHTFFHRFNGYRGTISLNVQLITNFL